MRWISFLLSIYLLCTICLCLFVHFSIELMFFSLIIWIFHILKKVVFSFDCKYFSPSEVFFISFPVCLFQLVISLLNFYILFSTVKNFKVDKLGNIFLSAFEVYFLLWKVFLIPDVWNNLYFSTKPSTSCRFSIYLCIFEQKIIL